MNKLQNNKLLLYKLYDKYISLISEKYNIDISELYLLSNLYNANINNKINLGLCCINNELRNQKPSIFNSRTCIRKNFTVEKARELSLQNVKDLIPMIEWNEKNSVKCFRLSSNIFPHFTDTETQKYDISHVFTELRQTGDLIKKYKHRVLMHPGQYNQVGAQSERVFQKTIEELTHHADILNAMGIDNNGVLIVHGGGMYGNKPETMQRWINNYFRLPKCVQQRLVIENCERCYHLEEVLYISNEVHKRGGTLPVVFDNHHYICYQQLHPNDRIKSIQELIPEVLKTWGKRRPVMHISEQGSGRFW
jgi:UV DNA damage endonuclease